MGFSKGLWFVALASAALFAQPALAELPGPVRDMIDTAIATDDEAKARTVIEIARTTYPNDAAEIDAILAGFEKRLAARKVVEAEAKRIELRTAGLFEFWDGKVEFGGFNSAGNTSTTGVTAALAIERTGINWRHRITVRGDYQRANGATTREQFMASYEPNVKISDRFYIYGLAQFERDQFQGFDGRYAVSGGIGYELIKDDDIQLSVKAGPAYRRTEFTDGRSESNFAALVALDFNWKLTDRLKLTQDTNAVAEAGGAAIAIIDSANTSVTLVTGLEASLSKSLKTRVSYAVEYDSNPPPGAVKTDTMTRLSLSYDF
ncbi:MAG: DUF481 domain-containing protein [Erythrobacter sp.]